MEKRLVTRYATQSREAADENQRRIEGVFEELNTAKPDNVSYLVLRLADDSFVHVSFHNHGDDDTNPIRRPRRSPTFKTVTRHDEMATSINRRRPWLVPTSPRSPRSLHRVTMPVVR